MKRNYEIAVISKGAFAKTVRIYAPKKARRALIVHDGAFMFEKADITALLKKSSIKDTAVIGIDSSPIGFDCYLPFEPETEINDLPAYTVQTDAYSEFINSALIPYLDKRFSFTRYAMLGAGAAAAFTLFYASTDNGKITEYDMFDAPLYICPKAFGKFLDTARFPANAAYRIIGHAGSKTAAGAIDIAAALQKNDVRSVELGINDNIDIIEFIEKALTHQHV